jgi:hypothetical protein
LTSSEKTSRKSFEFARLASVPRSIWNAIRKAIQLGEIRTMTEGVGLPNVIIGERDLSAALWERRAPEKRHQRSPRRRAARIIARSFGAFSTLVVGQWEAPTNVGQFEMWITCTSGKS